MAPLSYWLYLILGLMVSLYQGYRGYKFQVITTEAENRQARQENPRIAHHYSHREMIVLRAIADAFFYFVCTGSGFIAVCLLWQIGCTVSLDNIDGGTSALLIF